jgi:hypothetical protein
MSVTQDRYQSYRSTCCKAMLMKNQRSPGPSCSECGKPHYDRDFPNDVKRRNHALLMPLPEAENHMGKYIIPGKRGTYELVKTLNREVKSEREGCSPGDELAVFGCSILVLRPTKGSK